VAHSAFDLGWMGSYCFGRLLRRARGVCGHLGSSVVGDCLYYFCGDLHGPIHRSAGKNLKGDKKVKVECFKVEECSKGYRYFFCLVDGEAYDENSFSLVWCFEKPGMYELGKTYELELPK
jgi:hypothetical protein